MKDKIQIKQVKGCGFFTFYHLFASNTDLNQAKCRNTLL